MRSFGTQFTELPTQADCEAVTGRVLELIDAPDAQVDIYCRGSSTLTFARGRAYLSGTESRISARLMMTKNGKHAESATNQFDEPSLRALVRAAETAAEQNPTVAYVDLQLPKPRKYPTGPRIYFETTEAAAAPETQAEIGRQAVEAASAAKLLAAGDVRVETLVRAARNTEGFLAHERSNYGEFSFTARGTSNRASGWAWSGFEDWGRVKPAAVIARAVDLGVRSANPVAVEPGRYTVILEPPAVAAFTDEIIKWWSAGLADAGITVFGKDPRGTNKIGLQMMDARLGMIADPNDPDHPNSMMSVEFDWEPLAPVLWFERGVLRNLEYSQEYARIRGHARVIDPRFVRLTANGPTTSLEDMIASVKRGIWINRLSPIGLMNARTFLLTGTTRDGTFLIENGKITRPIKNLRFTESPFFVFNKLEAFGAPERASRQTVAPRMMVRDFDFTSLTDAI